MYNDIYTHLYSFRWRAVTSGGLSIICRCCEWAHMLRFPPTSSTAGKWSDGRWDGQIFVGGCGGLDICLAEYFWGKQVKDQNINSR